jgi:hypothetical protein
VDSGLSSVDRGIDLSGDRGVMESNMNGQAHSRTNSVDGSLEVLDAVDPGLCDVTATELESDAVMDQLIDQQLIELQTYASFITCTLRRSEYARVP